MNRKKGRHIMANSKLQQGSAIKWVLMYDWF